MITIEQKIEQMYKALEAMKVAGRPVALQPEIRRASTSISIGFDFTKLADRATASNRVSQLLNNIACLKDHLKVWCTKNNKPFRGDALINANKDVAIVHDLWNLDKHAELNRSRSGLFPKLHEPPRSALTLKAGPNSPSASFVMTVVGGPVQTQGNVSLRVVAQVVDKDGNPLGDLEDICQRAVDAWEAEFKSVGLQF